MIDISTLNIASVILQLFHASEQLRWSITEISCALRAR